MMKHEKWRIFLEMCSLFYPVTFKHFVGWYVIDCYFSVTPSTFTEIKWFLKDFSYRNQRKKVPADLEQINSTIFEY